MRHRLLLALNIAALVALVPVAILWVRTELTNDLIVLTGRYTTVYQISTSPGRVQAAWGGVNSPPAEPSWHHGDIPSTAAALPRTAINGDWRTLGVGAATARPAGASAPIQLLSIPLAPIAAILLGAARADGAGVDPPSAAGASAAVARAVPVLRAQPEGKQLPLPDMRRARADDHGDGRSRARINGYCPRRGGR